MARVDDILELIDVGLQSSDEWGYGTDRAPDDCARCQRCVPAEGGDMCDGCRAFLLGDSDVDPKHPRPRARIVDRDERWHVMDEPFAPSTATAADFGGVRAAFEWFDETAARMSEQMEAHFSWIRELASVTAVPGWEAAYLDVPMHFETVVPAERLRHSSWSVAVSTAPAPLPDISEALDILTVQARRSLVDQHLPVIEGGVPMPARLRELTDQEA